MISRLRHLFALAALAAAAAHAQTTVIQTQGGLTPVLEVQRLAPQLVQFAGGDLNFQNLVNGLAFGVPVTLTTSLAPGVSQIVTFTPVGTMSPTQIAQTLVNAQQVAIGNGIAVPTAQQLGVILNGGALPTALGSTTLNGLVSGNAATSVATRTQAAPPALMVGRTFNTSDSPFPRGVSDSPAGGVATPGVGAAASGATAPAAVSGRVMPAAPLNGVTPRFGPPPR